MATQMSTDDLQELADLRKVFDYNTSLQRVQDYGKWIFTAIASITALGAGLSNSAFRSLTTPGKLCFGLAIILSGVSLASSALLLAPQWLAVNRWSRDSMREALASQFKNRHRFTVVAAYSLAGALVLAGIAPAISTLCLPGATFSKLSYAYSKGTLEVSLALTHMAPDSNASFEIARADDPQKPVTVAQIALRTDESGTATRTIQISVPAGSYRLDYSCKTADGGDCPSKPEVVTFYDSATQPQVKSGDGRNAPVRKTAGGKTEVRKK
ncbi:MAG TPA: hypothetical protein VKW06_19230 [Candidatus Angelobacter sp.]|nr:hypothetical protein [Candidatus Angelobacter sp.]